MHYSTLSVESRRHPEIKYAAIIGFGHFYSLNLAFQAALSQRLYSTNHT